MKQGMLGIGDVENGWGECVSEWVGEPVSGGYLAGFGSRGHLNEFQSGMINKKETNSE